MGVELDNFTFPREYKKTSRKDIALLVAIAILVAVAIATQLFSLSKVSGESMMETVHNGDIIICLRINDNYTYGDLVTVPAVRKNDLNGQSIILIKRVVACPGDKIVFKKSSGGEVLFYLDKGSGFKRVDEPFTLDEKMKSSIFTSQYMFSSGQYTLYNGEIEDVYNEGADCIISLGSNEYFLLGDNRNNSRDSREYGPFEKQNFLGKVIAIYSKGTTGYGFFNFIYSSFFPNENTDDSTQASINKGELILW